MAGVILQNTVHGVFGQAMLAREGEESALPVQSQTVLSSKPQPAIAVLMNRPDAVVAEPVPISEHGSGSFAPPHQSLAFGAKPKTSLPVLQNRMHIVYRVPLCADGTIGEATVLEHHQSEFRGNPQAPGSTPVERAHTPAAIPFFPALHEHSILKFKQAQGRL